MICAYLAFTDTGLALAKRLAAALPGSVARCGRDGDSLAEWTSAQFVHSDALIFIGAAGIAVRAIAPHCKSKTTDPAVVVVDECGRFAVPILSGHLGGANDLARAIAAICGAVPVITTATDVHGIFAVDEWAKHKKLHGAGAGTHQAGQRQITGWTAGLLLGRYPSNGHCTRRVIPRRYPGKGRPLHSPFAPPGRRCILCRASGCWASAASGAQALKRWRPLLPPSAPGTALLRRQLPPLQAST